MEISWATPQDANALSRLWHTCFGDDQTFRDWFFANRFWPQYCLTAREDGIPVGAVYGLPTHLWVRQQVVPAVIIGGVSTHPEHRGKGIMHRLFADFMSEMHRREIPLTFLHPVREDLYFSLEHYTCSDRGLLTLHGNAPRPALPQNVAELEVGSRIADLHRCYQQYIQPYCGPVWRSKEAFAFKTADYKAGGAKLIAALNQKGDVEGYCYYFSEEESVMGEECVALSGDAFHRLAAALAHIAKGKELTVKLPADTLPTLEGAITEVKPWGCTGVAHLPTLLKTLCKGQPDFAIEVTDPVVEANNGTFDLQGNLITTPPQIKLSAGRVVQWLCGYRSLAQLAAEGHAAVYNQAAAAELDRLLPTQNCLCSEEY
ncbi:MAG: GNAT family N-acetyltransferase [Oscillospiraceae bacterium]|nr:GNAT family N-acetyltransferase [Oscillospiraceae bacterium]